MRTIVALCLLLLTACVSQDAKFDQITGSNLPLDFRLGFRHGCDSGYAADGIVSYKFTRDLHLYSFSNLYMEGWNQGYALCKQSRH